MNSVIAAIQPEQSSPRRIAAADRPVNPAGAAYWLLVAVILASATVAAHGPSLQGGLFFDDHWHRLQLETSGWGWSDLLNAATLEPSRFMDMWWQTEPIRWQYSRPVSIFLMKVVHEVSGGSVAAQHAVSILLHHANAFMVVGLVWRLTQHRYWSIVAGLLFVIYSHSVFAVGWLASQNTVLQTTLVLAAIHWYASAARLKLGPHEGSEPGLPGDSPVASCPQPGRLSVDDRVPAITFGSAAGIAVLYVLALYSRENAIMLPVVLVAFDLAFCGRAALARRRAFHAAMIAISIAFVAWRFMAFHAPMPNIYSRHFEGPATASALFEYGAWLLAKLLHYICSAIWLSPMVVGPAGRFNSWVEAPGDAILTVVIILVLGLGYYSATRRVRGWWIWPMWIVLAYLPVTPILPTPHQGYGGGVGFAIAMVLGPAMRRHVKPKGWPISAAVATWFLIATSIYIPIYRTLWNGMRGAESLTTAKLAAFPPPAGATDLFFINLPFVNIYTKLSLGEVWGDVSKDMRCHALAFAPAVTGMDLPCRLSQIDDHTLRVTLDRSKAPPGASGYFSGLLGRFLLEGMRDPTAPIEQPVRGLLFDVVVAHWDQEFGADSLEFRFHRPLASPEYRFYLATPNCALAELRFQHGSSELSESADVDSDVTNALLAKTTPSLQDVRLAAADLERGDSSAAAVLFGALAASPGPVRVEALSLFGPAYESLATALGAQRQDVAEIERLPDGDRFATWWLAARWWRLNVDDRQLREVWGDRDRFAAIRYQRDGIFRVRTIASGIIQTDLYMTGAPFPGPRRGFQIPMARESGGGDRHSELE